MYYFDYATYPVYPQEIINNINKILKKPITPFYKNILSLNKKNFYEINKVRTTVAQFINAKPSEIFFVKSASDAFLKIVNLINESATLDEEFLYNFDNHEKINKIVKNQLKIKIISYKLFSHSGDADYQDINNKINKKTKAIYINHLHGVYGLLAEPEKINKTNNLILIGDISHSISRTPINIKKTNFDIAFFSSYKVFGIEGSGIIYINEKTQDFFGKEKIKNLEDWPNLNLFSILTIKKGIDYLRKIGIENVNKYLTELTQIFVKELRFEEKIIPLPGVFFAKCYTGYGIISFRIKNIPSIELKDYFEKQKIYLRISNHCYKNKNDYIRVSFHYQTKINEIEYLIKSIKNLAKEL